MTYRLIDTAGMGLSPEATALYEAMLNTGDGHMMSPSDYTIWMDVYLDNATHTLPYRGKQLSGLFSALQAMGLYRPMDKAWGWVRVEDDEEAQ